MKNFKRFIAFLAVVLLVLSTQITFLVAAAPAGTAAKAGEIVTLSYEYDGIGGIYGVFSFSNPGMIENVSIDISPEFQGVWKNNTLAYFSMTPSKFIAVLTFKISDTAVAGDECEVTFKYETTVDGRVPDSQNFSYEITTIRIEAIDYTALKAQIAVVDGLTEGDYTVESWSAMKDVYNRAKALVDNASSQAQVDTMTVELKSAIDSLVRKPTAPAINYTALKEQIAIVDGLTESDYTVESWSAMKDVYNRAKALVDNASSQAQVDTMTVELKSAIGALVRKSTAPAINYTALKEQIAIVDGLTESDYTVESWSAMKDVYNRAKALVDNASSQTQVDTMTVELKSAIDSLVRKSTAPAIDYTALKAQIAIADSLKENYYTAKTWSAMKDVYNRAKALVNNATSQAQVDAMTADLKAAIGALVRKSTAPAIDYTALKAQIARADSLKENDYTEESWAAMKKVYDDAKKLVGKASSQAQVNTMTSNLKAVIDALELKTASSIDYTALKEQIAIVEGLKKDDYTEQSWSALKTVYDSAKKLVDNASSQAEVDTMTAELKAAINALKHKPTASGIDYTELKKQMAIADGLNKDDYTEESWAAMKKVYDDAKKLIGNASSQEEVDELTDKLEAAINALVKSSNSSGIIWWIIILILLIVVVIGIVVYIKRKKR